jgi:hypothetical protein
MIDFLKWIGTIILGCIVFVISVLIYMCFSQNKYHYEFIDLDNNSGVAKECSYESKTYRSGGQGSPVCELEDGTVKQVKEYKYIYDGEYIPIKEIFE